MNKVVGAGLFEKQVKFGWKLEEVRQRAWKKSVLRGQERPMQSTPGYREAASAVGASESVGDGPEARKGARARSQRALWAI